MRLAIILLILSLLQPAPPSLTARWAGSHTARIAWKQPYGVALTCLYRQTTLIRCWSNLQPGATYTTLGERGALDASVHPEAGDVYTLTMDDVTVRAPLRFVLFLLGMRSP